MFGYPRIGEKREMKFAEEFYLAAVSIPSKM
ncbi:hypothetical protein [Aquirhabdus parva]|uniref:Uncharacterized protein n=1 Tax=Aquirhabdus parva TaxID=2283318 RepID=A0A345PBM1_9GAMM|nr:hypothetical protein HYN46_12185 [Aquirhabdus parva]